MEKWIQEQKQDIDTYVKNALPAHWPTLGLAYERITDKSISLEALLVLLYANEKPKVNNGTLAVAAAVHLTGLGLRMRESLCTGIDPKEMLATWGILLLENYAAGFISVAKKIIAEAKVSASVKATGLSMLQDTVLNSLSAQNLLIEDVFANPLDFRRMVAMGSGAIFSMAAGGGMLSRTMKKQQLAAALRQGQHFGVAVFFTNLRHMLKLDSPPQTIFNWGLSLALEYTHDFHDELIDLQLDLADKSTASRLREIFHEIELDKSLQQIAKEAQQEFLEQNAFLPGNHETRALLAGIVEQTNLTS